MADTSQQNEVSEHKNKTLMEGVLTMLQQSGFIKAFWGEAILTANYFAEVFGGISEPNTILPSSSIPPMGSSLRGDLGSEAC